MKKPDVDRREWDQLAREDPMWAVCSDPSRPGAWDQDAFFATGEAEIAGLLAGLEEHGLLPRAGRALDFGCGLGRLTRALGSRFDEAVGVDISREMVRTAGQLNAAFANCRFVANDRSDLAMFDSGSFDLVVSLITLQHLSSPDAVRGYLREFVRVTSAGGAMVFQIPARVGWQVRWHPLRLLNRLVRALPAAPGWALRRLMPWSMRLVALSEDLVRSTVVGAGADLVTSFPDRRTGSDAVPSRVYVARRV